MGTFDARAVWKTDEGDLIYLTYTGRSLIPDDVRALFADPAKPPVDPSRYYLRIAAVFETASETYGWLNGTLAVGVGATVSAAAIEGIDTPTATIRAATAPTTTRRTCEIMTVSLPAPAGNPRTAPCGWTAPPVRGEGGGDAPSLQKSAPTSAAATTVDA